MSQPLPHPAHPAIERVRAHASAHGVAVEVRRYPAGTRTAQDAAREIGCDVAQIVKSLVFLVSGDPVVVLVSGADRVDEGSLAAVLDGGTVRRATANEVRDLTGSPIGGVPPFGHRSLLPVVVDRSLLAHEVVWAAAGLPDAVFPIAPAELARLSGARLAVVALRDEGALR